MEVEIPRIPLDEWCDVALDWATDHFSGVTRAISHVIGDGVESITTFLVSLPPWALIPVIGLLVWRLTTPRIAIFCVVGFAFLWNLGLWDATVESLVLVLMSTLFTLVIGIPIGILAAMNRRFWRTISPLLDLMQTMPSFVYLIPAIPFFGLGAVSACFATIVFAMPPTIRLTALGILQTPSELVEVADAFGSTRWEKLRKVQLPLAMPTIMAGVNQTIMLALSMVVISAMIGAGGLGGEVWKAIQRLEAGAGFQAGIAIVVLAVILDRITQHVARSMGSSRKAGTTRE